ncbi:membrane dipeptidase [Arenicella sp. 4NH20-0111]|uniref:dipeptidase n=1 Tax=Arenicella sp. 4NH20-0111 TaxID=3127648 RepID=UPI003102E7B0
MKKIILIIVILFALLLVGFLTVAPSRVDGNLNPVTTHQPYPVSAEAQKLHNSLIVGDWHADTLLWNRDIAKQHDYSHIDIPRLQKGNVGLQMFTTVTKSPSGLNYDSNSTNAPDDITKLALAQRWPIATWNSLTARALHQADKLHQFAEASPQKLVIIKTKSDLASWAEHRKSNPKLIGGLLGTEGSHALDGKIENVQQLFDAGFRMMSLQHFFDNKLGGSLHGTSQAGLSEFGRSVIEKMEELDIVLDVSHSSENTVRDVLALTNRALVVSHTGFKGHCDTARNISDDLMKQIASRGGLIAVGYWDGAICGDTPSDVVGAMKYGLSLVGEDHISLGSDFDGTVTTGFDTSELSALTHEMLKQGFSDTQIRKIMGQNMHDLLAAQLPSN